MGFYATDAACIRRKKTHPPSKNRVRNFFSTSRSRARLSMLQPLDTRREKRSTPTKTVSGVRYYGYRYYSPAMGRWLSRDPIGEFGGMNLYNFAQNMPISSIDLLGLNPIIDAVILELINWILEHAVEWGLESINIPAIIEIIPIGNDVPCEKGQQPFITEEKETIKKLYQKNPVLNWEQEIKHTIEQRYKCLCKGPTRSRTEESEFDTVLYEGWHYFYYITVGLKNIYKFTFYE